MKKICLFMAAAICAFMVQAADYPYLVFTNSGGTTTIMNVENLTFNANGTSLEVSNADGTTSFTLTDLENMQFSKDGNISTAFENVLEANQAVEVFSVSGKNLGTYNSLIESVRILNSGAYVIKQGTNTQTIIIR